MPNRNDSKTMVHLFMALGRLPTPLAVDARPEQDTESTFRALRAELISDDIREAREGASKLTAPFLRLLPAGDE